MFLNHEQLKLQKIIEGFTEDNFADGSYNLTIDQIINMESQISNSFTLKPQGMVYVVFKEKMNVPLDIIGFAHVKTSLTKRGIMATNIGIIDSNYKGYISTLLINFGKSDCFLHEGDPALRVTFSKIQEPGVKHTLAQNNLSSTEYIKNVQKDIVNLDEKFLNLNSVEKEVKESVTSSLKNSFGKYALLFAAASFLVGMIFSYKNAQEKDVDRAIRKYETELSIINENNKLLQAQLNNYEIRLKSLQDSLKLIKIKF